VADQAGTVLLLLALGFKAIERASPSLRSWSALWLGIALMVAVCDFTFYPLWRCVQQLVNGALLLAVLLVTEYFGVWVPTKRKQVWAAAVLAVTAVVVLSLSVSGHLSRGPLGLLGTRVDNCRQPTDDVDILARKFYGRSDKNALILIPPTAFGFKLYSERAVVAEFKAHPFTDAGLVEWRQRMEDVLGKPITRATRAEVYWSAADALYSRRQAFALVSVAEKYRADFILSRRSWHPSLTDWEFMSQGDWVIWRTKGDGSRGERP
jgi:hypothetical protein